MLQNEIDDTLIEKTFCTVSKCDLIPTEKIELAWSIILIMFYYYF